MLATWFLVPLPFLNPAWTSGSSRFMYCQSLAWRILSITLLACEMSAIVRWVQLWDECKECTQCTSKFGKVNSGHRTGNGQFSFQSQRKAIPENVHTTAQLHSSHTLAKEGSKFFKPGYNSRWTVNFQMFKLDLEKAEEPEIKLPTSTGSSKKQENSWKTSTSALLITPKPLMV